MSLQRALRATAISVAAFVLFAVAIILVSATTLYVGLYVHGVAGLMAGVAVAAIIAAGVWAVE